MHENSSQALKEIDLNKREAQVMGVLKNASAPLSAREIAKRMGSPERNTAAPRITALKGYKLVEEAGKVRCPITDKPVALFQLTEKGRYYTPRGEAASPIGHELPRPTPTLGEEPSLF